MKPCFVTTSFAPGQLNSGISNAAYLLMKYMYEKKGVRSTVFAPQQAWGTKDANHGFVSIKRFKTSSFAGFGFSSSLKGRMDEINGREKFDLVHSFHYGFYPATAGYGFSNNTRLPHFFTTAFHPPVSSIKRSLMSFYSHTQGKRILAGSSSVFPFNENEKRQLSSYSKGNYNVVPCPVNDEIFYPRKTKFSRKTVTYIGTLLPWKGPQIALEIFNRISAERRDIDFLIIGTGPLDSYLRKNASKAVKVLTNMPADHVAEKLSRSDLVVCPTSYESFGSAIAESMMCGTTVLSTRVGAVPETVGPGGTLVEYGDWDGMKSAIIDLIDDDKKRKILSRKAIKQSNNYKYKKVAKRVYNTYIRFA